MKKEISKKAQAFLDSISTEDRQLLAETLASPVGQLQFKKDYAIAKKEKDAVA